jgi:hypothetical protein
MGFEAENEMNERPQATAVIKDKFIKILDLNSLRMEIVLFSTIPKRAQIRKITFGLKYLAVLFAVATDA